jgi:hypothetical protein
MSALQDSQLLAKSKDLKQQAAPITKKPADDSEKGQNQADHGRFLITEMEYGSAAILLISKADGILARDRSEWRSLQ